MVTCTYKSHVRSADRPGTWSFSQRGRVKGGGVSKRVKGGCQRGSGGGGRGGGSKGVKGGGRGGEVSKRAQGGGSKEEPGSKRVKEEGPEGGGCQREERKRFEKKDDFNEKSISKRVY